MSVRRFGALSKFNLSVRRFGAHVYLSSSKHEPYDLIPRIL